CNARVACGLVLDRDLARRQQFAPVGREFLGHPATPVEGRALAAAGRPPCTPPWGKQEPNTFSPPAGENGQCWRTEKHARTLDAGRGARVGLLVRSHSPDEACHASWGWADPSGANTSWAATCVS